MLKLNIIISSSDNFLLKQQTFFIKKYFNLFLSQNSSFFLLYNNIVYLNKKKLNLKTIYIPVRLSPITILRSPHIFKKSKEKFIHKFYKILLSGTLNFSFSYISFFIFLSQLLNNFITFFPSNFFIKLRFLFIFTLKL